MERVTITIDQDLLEQIDALSTRRGYGNRSEVFRDIARAELARATVDEEAALDNEQLCYGTLTYVYDHGMRDLPARLTDNHHLHHAISVATTHVHVDHDNCLEVSILSGKAGDLRKFADSVISQRGVTYGKLHMIPMSAGTHHHHHHHHD